MKNTKITIIAKDGLASASLLQAIGTALNPAAHMLENELLSRGLFETGTQLTWVIEAHGGAFCIGHGAVFLEFLGKPLSSADVQFNQSGGMSLDGVRFQHVLTSPAIIQECADLLQRQMPQDVTVAATKGGE